MEKQLLKVTYEVESFRNERFPVVVRLLLKVNEKERPIDVCITKEGNVVVYDLGTLMVPISFGSDDYYKMEREWENGDEFKWEDSESWKLENINLT